MSEAGIAVAIDGTGVATLTLDRPAVHNAFDEAMIAALTRELERLGADPAVRVVVLRGAGKSFSAGADLAWMRRMAGFDRAQNEADALRLAALLATLDRLPKPTVAVVHGSALGGGVGLVAACDIAIAAEAALFALSEVRLGLIPAVIAPYVVAAIGARACRRLMLTGERFSAARALQLGLVHEVVPAEGLEGAVAAVLDSLRQGGPEAQADAKALLAAVAGRPVDQAMMADTAARIAARRASAEGREGMAAFLERRPPDWLGSA